MTATTASRPAGHSNQNCQPLLDAAHLNIYRENTFRITGLPVDASEREMRRQAATLKRLEEFGAADEVVTHAYALRPPPTVEQIRAAMQRLKDPEHRLVDEFFWFWPREFGRSSDDSALRALGGGDLEAAYAIWKELESDATADLVASHNLALLYHIAAVEWTDFHLGNHIDYEREKKIRTYWQDAFQRWEKIATDDRTWSLVKERARALDDPRLTTGFVRRMEQSLPEALDKINAEAALRFAQANQLDWAKRHVDWMNETHQGLDDVDKTARLVLEPTRKRVRQLLANAKEGTLRDPCSGAEAARMLVDQCRPLKQLFELFHGEECDHKADLFDEVASQINASLVQHGKATGLNGENIDVMRVALELSTSPSMREVIQKNIGIREQVARTAFLEPYLKHVRGLVSSTIPAKDRVIFARKQVIPSIHYLSGKETPISPNVVELCEATASAMHGVAVDANNKEKDYATAVEAIEIAESFAKSPKLKEAVATAAQIMRKNLGDSNTKKRLDGLTQPIFDRLEQLSSNPSSAAVAFDRIQRDVLPMFDAIKIDASAPSGMLSAVAESIALALRDISIKANNDEKDYDTATKAITLACSLPTAPKIKEQLLKDKATLAGNLESHRSNFVDLKLRSDHIEITDKAVRYNGAEIPCSEVSGVRWGVFVQYVNGVRSSVSYHIGISGAGHVLKIECKRFWRSEEQAQEDYKAILVGLLVFVVPGLARRVATTITRGTGYDFGSAKCDRTGVLLKSGMLMWGKEQRFSWDDIEISENQGSLTVYARSNPKFTATATLRDHWNAVVFKQVAQAVSEQ
jgi:hypothetical protein